MGADREDTEVLVIGAGPVGLLAARCLADRGVRVRIVDPYHRAALHSYALALHPRTLRLLDRLGLAERLVQRGQPIRRIALRVDGDRVATIDLARVGDPFPYVLCVSQVMLEAALDHGLADAGVEVLWGHQALTFEDDGDAVQVVVAAVPPEPGEADPAPVEIATFRQRARYVIGADGHESLTRRLLGIENDEVAPPATYGLIEFEAPIEPCDEMTLSLADGTTDVLWPLGPERARWSVQLEEFPDAVDADLLRERIAERAPWTSPRDWQVDWVTAVTFRPRLARSFGHGRVWLAGDAARQTLPTGVHGLNVGLREAYDLARRLAAVLRGERTPDLLRFYHEEREREWKMLLGVHDRLRPRGPAPEWARRHGPRIVSGMPSTGRDLNRLLEQVGLRLSWLRGADGRRSERS